MTLLARAALMRFLTRQHSRVMGKMRAETGSPHCFLVNSIPKSGTNLLRGIVREIPGTREMVSLSPFYLIRDPEERLRRLREVVHDLRPGRCYVGHLPHSPEVALWLRKQGFKHLLIVRDPRGVAVSAFHYYMRDVPLPHVFRAFLSSLPDDDVRMAAIIAGQGQGRETLCYDPPASFPGMKAFFGAWEGWRVEDVFIVRYEDLIQPQGGPTPHALAIFENMLAYLDIPANMELLCGMIKDGMASRANRTFRKGTSAGWEEELTPRHLSLLAESAATFARFGYHL